MTQKFLKLLLLVSCVVPAQVSARADSKQAAKSARQLMRNPKTLRYEPLCRNLPMDDAALTDASSDLDPDHLRKQLTSLEIAGPLYVRDLASVGALSVESGASIGGDLSIDGRLFVNTINGAVNINGSLSVNGIPLASPTGGPALYQYAYFYQTGGQTINGTGNNGIVRFDYASNNGTAIGTTAVTGANTSGITVLNNAAAGNTQTGTFSTISITVPGTYLINYAVTGAIGTSAGTFGFDLVGGVGGTTAINGSFYGLLVDGDATPNDLEISGQVILVVPNTASVATPYQLQLVEVGAGTTAATSYFIEPSATTAPVVNAAVGASLTILKIA